MSKKDLSRRSFIRLSALAASGAVVAACSPVTATPSTPAAPTSPAGQAPTMASAPTEAVSQATQAAAPTQAPAEGEAVLQWWDHYQPLEPLHKKLFEQYSAAHPNVKVEQTVFNPPDLGKALQLAYPNNQAPDVHTLAGVTYPASALIDEGWLAPLDEYIDEEWKGKFPNGSFIEGLNVFGGKVYSFPTFSFLQYTNVTWWNKQLAADAGVNPETDFLSWDSLRASVKKITDKGGGQTFGWIEGIGFVDRMADHMNDIAMAAGSPGPIDFKTGEYQYATDPYVNGIEWWMAMANDGSLFPSSNTLDMRNGRARWVTGVACVFFDGPWNPGAVLTIAPDFADSMGVSPCPTPDGKPGIIGRGPATTNFWLSAQSKAPQHGAGLMKMLISDEYQIGLAERQDQPPLMASAVEKANVHPTYKQQMKFFANSVRLVPQPQVRNSLVNDVNAEMKPIHPNLGEIIQGAISGDVKDVKKALQEFNDATSAERDRAVKVVQGKGGKVSQDDWVFSDWTQGKDYLTKPNA